MIEWLNANIVTIAVTVCAIGELALIDYLWDQIRRMKEDPYEKWMDYKKYKESRR